MTEPNEASSAQKQTLAGAPETVAVPHDIWPPSEPGLTEVRPETVLRVADSYPANAVDTDEAPSGLVAVQAMTVAAGTPFLP
ncbi:MAG: hypothetical protein U0R76_14845 [Candidatus Nanopelagicales bacterium]